MSATMLFITGDIGGNVPPTLAIATELAARGHRVIVAGLEPRADRAAGELELRSLRALDGMDVRPPAGPLGHTPALTRMAVGRALAREVGALIDAQSPDAVIVDGVMLASIRAAVSAGVPTAVLFHSLGAFWAAGMASRGANLAMRPLGLAPLALLRRADALLLPTDPVLDPAHAVDGPIDFEWIGTTEPGSSAGPRGDGPKRVLVSLSSAWQRGQADVYRRILAALAPLPIEVAVTTGGVQLDGALTAPSNTVIHARVPHEQLMPGIDLVIGHGGHSTTMKAVSHGIPLLVVPLDRTSDQPLIGRTIEAAGLGRTIAKSSSSEHLRAVVTSILGDTAIADAAAAAGVRLRSQRGAARGAEMIERISRGEQLSPRGSA